MLSKFHLCFTPTYFVQFLLKVRDRYVYFYIILVTYWTFQNFQYGANKKHITLQPDGVDVQLMFIFYIHVCINVRVCVLYATLYETTIGNICSFYEKKNTKRKIILVSPLQSQLIYKRNGEQGWKAQSFSSINFVILA